MNKCSLDKQFVCRKSKLHSLNYVTLHVGKKVQAVLYCILSAYERKNVGSEAQTETPALAAPSLSKGKEELCENLRISDVD